MKTPKQMAEEYAFASVGAEPRDELIGAISYLYIWQRDKKFLAEGFLAGYSAALQELEQREREAFEAGRAMEGEPGQESFVFSFFSLYKKSRGE